MVLFFVYSMLILPKDLKGKNGCGGGSREGTAKASAVVNAYNFIGLIQNMPRNAAFFAANHQQNRVLELLIKDRNRIAYAGAKNGIAL